MAFGTLKADTLTHSTAGSLATNFVVEGTAKCWFLFQGNGTAAVDDSFNVSSLDDDGTGQYGIHYTNSFDSANQSVAGDNSNGNAGSTMRSTNFHTTTTSTVDMDAWYISTGNASQDDPTDCRGVVHGDLA